MLYESRKSGFKFGKSVYPRVRIQVTHGCTRAQPYHIRGVDNIIADTISRFKNDLAVSLCLGLVIRNLEPPRDALGVAQK